MDSEIISDNNINSIIPNNNKYNHNYKKNLIKRISDIKNKKCYIKIFRIIYNNNNHFTRNDNGVFFNITNLSDEILYKIDNIVKYFENKKEKLELELIHNFTNSNDISEDSININNYLSNYK